MATPNTFNPVYTAVIRKTNKDGSGIKDLAIYANLSEQFMFDSAAEYEPAFGNLFGGGFLKALNIFGTKPLWQAMTAQVWSGTSSDDITLKFVFQAETDAYRDVVLPVYQLESLVAAGTNKIGMLTSPVGGIDFMKVYGYIKTEVERYLANNTPAETQQAQQGGILANPQSFAARGTMKSGTNPAQNQTPAGQQQQQPAAAQFGTRAWLESMMASQVSIDIGTQITFDNIVPLNVSKTITTQPDERGYMQYCEVDFRFRPMFLITREDLGKIFHIRPEDLVDNVEGTANTQQAIDPNYASEYTPEAFAIPGGAPIPSTQLPPPPMYISDQSEQFQNYFS